MVSRLPFFVPVERLLLFVASAYHRKHDPYNMPADLSRAIVTGARRPEFLTPMTNSNAVPSMSVHGGVIRIPIVDDFADAAALQEFLPVDECVTFGHRSDGCFIENRK